MRPNFKITKQLLIGTHQKLRHANMSSLELKLNGIPIEKVKNEKLLGLKLDQYLSWNDQVDCLMKKLNSRFFLLKRAKGYLSIPGRKMLYNVLIKSTLEYCLTV